MKFAATIVLVIAFIVAASWAMLQTYNVQTIGTPAHISEVHVPASDDAAFAKYIEDQKEYEAHFITLASSIKEQEQERLTKALALTAIFSISIGTVIAFFAAKKLTEPVIDAYNSQERFIQDAAHELRNPLAALTAALQQTKLKDPLITIFRRQTKRLIHINEDLLFLERRSKQQPTSTNVSELLQDVIEELQPLAHKKSIVIKQSIESDTIKTIAPNDYIRLVKNIIDNALKYSLNNSTVKISQKKVKNNIVIKIVDQGIGIPKEEIPTIGDRFYRASNTGEIDGTGLGIAIVQKILNSYGGSINIESVINAGTKVTITLPT
jgi:two-component system phosphate regulon sensor histidine kinase PhoR